MVDGQRPTTEQLLARLFLRPRPTLQLVAPQGVAR